jgi:hypothetical protein
MGIDFGIIILRVTTENGRWWVGESIDSVKFAFSCRRRKINWKENQKRLYSWVDAAAASLDSYPLLLDRSTTTTSVGKIYIPVVNIMRNHVLHRSYTPFWTLILPDLRGR